MANFIFCISYSFTTYSIIAENEPIYKKKDRVWIYLICYFLFLLYSLTIFTTSSSVSNPANSFGGIVGSLVNSKVNNCYNVGSVSSSSIIGGITGYIRDGAKSLSISQLKSAYSELGSAFKQDSNNINNGYPILYWQ